VAVLLELELGRRRLDAAPDRVQPTHSGISQPGEHQLAGDAGGDHLVIDHIRRHPGERQVALPLADDLVARREADQVGEALDRDRVPVPDEVGDRVAHRGDLAHGSIMPARRQRVSERPAARDRNWLRSSPRVERVLTPREGEGGSNGRIGRYP
jgi:hypothetical protein